MGRYPWREPLKSTGDIGFHNDYFGPVPHSDEFDEAVFEENKWIEGPIGGEYPPQISENDFNMEDAVPFVLKAGSISLHHVRALHGSAPNMSNRPRRLLLQGYLAADAFPLQSNLSTSTGPNITSDSLPQYFRILRAVKFEFVHILSILEPVA